MSFALVESEPLEWARMTNPAGQRESADTGGFARLLARLHADPEEAALEYERLRARLVRFFDWRGIATPEECTDEVFDRLAHKLEETAVQDVVKYVFGIARLVALEQRRVPRHSPVDDVAYSLASPEAPAETSALQECFDRCLAELPEESRALLLSYYEGERQAKIVNRRRLATNLGVTENALRSRVQRLRDHLERSIRACGATA